jgi:tRNA threonylcarbamoyladenosine biosynthesis protein TsaB
MTFLVMDTSGEYAVLALATDEGVVQAASVFEGKRSLSRRLMGQMDGLLKVNGVTLDDVSAFAVGIGPGSFTGVRVGVTTAKTLAQVTGKPLVGIGTLEAYADGWRDSDVTVVPVLPSRRGEVYTGVYERGQAREAPFAASYEAMASRLSLLYERGPLVICGATGLLPPRGYPAQAQPFVPPEGLARLAAERLKRGDMDDPLALVPLYVVAPSISTPRRPDEVLPGGSPP